MFKRNDGYALSYVLVVLLVLGIIAAAVMAPPLRNLQQQQASIQRMQEKYAAQGMIEQVVAQLPSPSPECSPPCQVVHDGDTYTITANNGDTTITAKVKVTTADGKNTVTYDSYDISYDTGGGS